MVILKFYNANTRSHSHQVIHNCNKLVIYFIFQIKISISQFLTWNLAAQWYLDFRWQEPFHSSCMRPWPARPYRLWIALNYLQVVNQLCNCSNKCMHVFIYSECEVGFRVHVRYHHVIPTMISDKLVNYLDICICIYSSLFNQTKWNWNFVKYFIHMHVYPWNN